MSDKLKTMQTCLSEPEIQGDLYCASAGYPELSQISNILDGNLPSHISQPSILEWQGVNNHKTLELDSRRRFQADRR